MKLLFKITGVFFFLLICTQAIAQKTYVTKQGFMIIKAYSGDSLKSYRFNNIVVLLDYDRAIVEMSFKLDDSLDDIDPSNSFFSNHDAKITTQLPIPKIETQPHPDWAFDTEGKLFFNEEVYYMNGNGELRHNEGSEVFSCYLMLRLELREDRELVLESIGKVKELHLFETVLNQKTLDKHTGH